jgi:hypothetical protein
MGLFCSKIAFFFLMKIILQGKRDRKVLEMNNFEYFNLLLPACSMLKEIFSFSHSLLFGRLAKRVI